MKMLNAFCLTSVYLFQLFELWHMSPIGVMFVQSVIKSTLIGNLCSVICDTAKWFPTLNVPIVNIGR